MSKVSALEEQVHGRQRQLEDEDELRFGVVDEMLYARATPPVEGAQWTGLVTRIAISMLESGAVDAVVCVQSDENDRCALPTVTPRSAAGRCKGRPPPRPCIGRENNRDAAPCCVLRAGRGGACRGGTRAARSQGAA